jgi:F-box and leucine-rich repeat protein GRR1
VHLLIHTSQEFNTTQRSQFCVFAGDGVKKLRRFLTDLFNSITEEMNDSMDVDDVPLQETVSPSVLQEQSPISQPSPSLATIRPVPRPHGHANHHSTLQHSVVRLHGTSTRDVEMRIEHPSSSRNSRSTTRSSTHSPPPNSNPIPGPSRLNPTERLATSTSPAGSEGSSAGAFFLTYQSSSADGRPDGMLTPDLVFAEIGHGHGPAVWPGQDQNQNQVDMFVDPPILTVEDRPQFGTNPPHALGGGARRPATQAAEVGQGPFGTNGAFHGVNGHGANGTMNGTYHTSAPYPLPTNGTNTHGINGAGIPSGITQGPPMTREERSRGRSRTLHEPVDGQAAQTPPGQGQGRGPKRTFRSALNSVEQHATPFFFGRPLQDGEGSSASTTTRKDDSTRGY